MKTKDTINERWFSTWFDSPYYSILYQHRDEEEAAAFIDRLTDTLRIAKTAYIADIPCGNGRHARYLAGKGYRVFGCDLSERNVAQAATAAHPQLEISRHDMRLAMGVNVFDVVLNLFTSLGYFHGDYQDVRIIHNFYASLKPGGTLVVDYFNAAYVLKNLEAEKQITIDSVGFHIQKYFDGRRIIKTIEIQDGEQRFYYAERVRAYSDGDLKKLIQQAGFSIEHVFGDYQLNSFDKDASPRCIIAAKKNKS